MHDHPRGGQPDKDGDDFQLSLEDMLDRVTDAARRRAEARETAPSPPGRAVEPPAAVPRDDDTSAEITHPDIGPFVLAPVRQSAETTPASAAAMPSAAVAPPDIPPSRPAPDRASVDTPSMRRQHRVRLATAAGSLVAAVVVLAWVSPFDRATSDAPTLALADLPPPAAGPARTARPSSSAVAMTAPAARLPVAIDMDASTEASMLAELGRAASPGDVALSATGAAAAPRFAVARYDALSSEPVGWRIVAPLNVEEVYALVRADSPLRWLHELRGRRIDVGAAGSARARSGDAFYQSLFGSPLAARNAVALPRDAALQRLLAGRDVDALLLFDGQPSHWLASLPAGTRRQLRLLRFAPDNAASRRALQVYLPATVDALAAQDTDNARAPVATLGVLSFLLAAPDARDVGLVARSLCDELPALRRHGHLKWREVQLSLRLPAGLPEAPEAVAALDTCATPVAPSPQPATSGARS